MSPDWSLFPRDLPLMPYLILLAWVQHVTIGHIVICLSLHIHSFLHPRSYRAKMWVVGGEFFSLKSTLLKQVWFLRKIFFLFQYNINRILHAGGLCRASFTYLILNMKVGDFQATLMALSYRSWNLGYCSRISQFKRDNTETSPIFMKNVCSVSEENKSNFACWRFM